MNQSTSTETAADCNAGDCSNGRTALDARRQGRFELVPAEAPPRPGTDAFVHRMRAVGDVLHRASVAAIYLIHGTFAGDDPFGVTDGLSAVFPRAGGRLRRLTKRAVDRVIDDTANYTAEYAALMQSSLTVPGLPGIPVRQFVWSGQNNHLGRAAAAVRLIDQIDADRLAAGQRVLVWTHSHAGNVLALVSQLLAADCPLREPFFAAAEIYFQRSDAQADPQALWQRVRQRLASRQAGHAENRSRPPGQAGEYALDVVTFGTPIRYPWNAGGVGHLLHVVNHHPQAGCRVERSALPRSVDDIFRGAGGDYVQHAGVNGTNFPPPPWCWRALLADYRLHQVITPEVRWYQLRRNLRAGRRVAGAGTTLLVDYGAEPSRWIRHLFGHSIYTRSDWMLFHAELAAKYLYGMQT